LSQPQGKGAGVFMSLQEDDQSSVVKDYNLGIINYQTLLALCVQKKQFYSQKGVFT
jgi:hypothetical protein